MWSDLQNKILQVIPDLIRDLLASLRYHVPGLTLPVPGMTRDLPAKGFAPPSASPQRAFGACMSILGKKKPGHAPIPEAP